MAASLYFKYSSMNAGKSSHLIQANYNYMENGSRTVVFTASIDDRYGVGLITSRTGSKLECQTFSRDLNFIDAIEEELRLDSKPISAILIDEAQFLTREQVDQLAEIVDSKSIPVLTYGLRTDAFLMAFEGSARLLEIADNLEEIKSLCRCNKKAITQIRIDENRVVQRGGEQVCIGGNDMYIPVCRKHYKRPSEILDVFEATE
ncbi:thymidine kinase [Aeromonas sp. 23P]|uniref:thymidine kinase n=1 Tax=Aeromonas sp. 23P TaxID=3452716 RepID=UPI003F7A2079